MVGIRRPGKVDVELNVGFLRKAWIKLKSQFDDDVTRS